MPKTFWVAAARRSGGAENRNPKPETRNPKEIRKHRVQLLCGPLPTPARSKSEFYEGGTIPWVKSGEVAQGMVTATEEHITELGLKHSSAKLFPVNTVLVAMYGATTGEVGLLKIPATTNQAVCGILPNDRFVPEFLFYVLRALKDEMKQRSGGGAQPNISQQIIRDLEIPLPPLEVQRRIVAEIEGYQKVLDGARQILAGYKPRVEVSSDWPTVEVAEVAEFKNGVNYSKESAGTGIKVLGVRHFQSHVVAPLDDLDEINPEGVLSDGHILEDGDLIFVRSNGNKQLVGRCLLVQPKGLRLTHSAFTIRMRLDRKHCEPKFYAFLFRLPEFRAQMMGGGANINNLSQDILKAIEIPLPPLAEQRRIVAELDAEAAQMEAVRSLLPRFEAKIQRVLDRVWGTQG